MKEGQAPMSKETYNEGKKAFYDAYLVKLNELDLEFCLSNNTYKEGDIIEDHMGKGIWSGKYAIYYGRIIPIMAYDCRVCKKDGTPTKKEEYRWIYASNILIKK